MPPAQICSASESTNISHIDRAREAYIAPTEQVLHDGQATNDEATWLRERQEAFCAGRSADHPDRKACSRSGLPSSAIAANSPAPWQQDSACGFTSRVHGTRRRQALAPGCTAAHETREHLWEEQEA